MEKTIKGIPLFYEEHGEGKPILCIHGYSLDHRMMTGCMEPLLKNITGYRRIYVDLPGMGQTPSAWVKTSEDMLEVLTLFIDAVFPEENFLIAGESFGGFLTLGLIDKLNERIDGAVLLCPLITHECYSNKLPERQIIYKSDELASPEENAEIKDFLNFAVIATPEMFERYQREIATGYNLSDKEFLFNGGFTGSVPALDSLYKTLKFDKPACIITGRQDHCVGYSYAYQLLENFPRATFAILDCAGHSLQLESEQLFSQLIMDWLWRVDSRNESTR
ncbi:MAG: alpha/beta hydrolase [Lachnospiraceae bacterium]|nr:alpha/beta hydrolase [Lachnospiraceae bacterium]